MLLTTLAFAVTAHQATSASDQLLAAAHEPNYAATLLAPIENTDLRPRLFPARRNLPIRVAVSTDPALVRPYRLDLVKAACEKWAAATAGLNPGLSFAYVADARTAEIVFSFRRSTAKGTLRGLTVERGGWASVEIAVEDAQGRDYAPEGVLRIATHEVGHALGIWGHSPNARDVMSVNLATSEISTADVNTLLIAYGR